MMASPKPSPRRRLKPADRQEHSETPAPTSGEQHHAAAEVAEYIANMSAELAKMAGDARLNTLTYYLDLARIEAELHVRKPNSSPD
jgi:hypothetical protein